MTDMNQQILKDFLDRARSAQEAVNKLTACRGRHCVEHPLEPEQMRRRSWDAGPGGIRMETTKETHD